MIRCTSTRHNYQLHLIDEVPQPVALHFVVYRAALSQRLEECRVMSAHLGRPHLLSKFVLGASEPI